MLNLTALSAFLAVASNAIDVNGNFSLGEQLENLVYESQFRTNLSLNSGVSTEVLVLPNGSTLAASYDDASSLLTYTVHVAENSYLGIGYGADMKHTNLNFWAAGPSAAESAVYNGYSDDNTFPYVVDQIFTSTIADSSNTGFIDFISTRPLDPPASDTKSRAITLG